MPLIAVFIFRPYRSYNRRASYPQGYTKSKSLSVLAYSTSVVADLEACSNTGTYATYVRLVLLLFHNELKGIGNVW
jgi:hypothetical protein